jgi:hypothetical protein
MITMSTRGTFSIRFALWKKGLVLEMIIDLILQGIAGVGRRYGTNGTEERSICNQGRSVLSVNAY